MRCALADDDPVPTLFDLLSDEGAVPDEELPSTGVGIEWERRLAAALITGADYGTRASTVLTLSATGEAFFEERSRTPDGAVAGVAQYRFALRADARVA
jgi:uncharacterized protein with NRDE domain